MAVSYTHLDVYKRQPVEFIPLLEETGLIIPAGRFVLNEAAAMCHEMRQYIPVSYTHLLRL